MDSTSDHVCLQERPVPEARHEWKLGLAANPSEILALAGDPARGSAVFHRADTACGGCYRIKGQGREFGPDLDGIGTIGIGHARRVS